MSDVVSSVIALARAWKHERTVERLAARFAKSAAEVPNAQAYAHLHTFSLAAASLRPTSQAARSVTVVLPELNPQKIFAGIRTALEFGCAVASHLRLPLRIVVLWSAPVGAAEAAVREYLAKEFPDSGVSVSVLSVDGLVGLAVNPEDVWIVTHWTTAHPLAVAARLGTVPPDKVLYLVQDYEPGFTPWSSDFALARATYHAGFQIVVNSTPLRDYLLREESIDTPSSLVFAPSIDLGRLRDAARSRAPSPEARILFYGRPSRPRNLYDIGMSALHLTAHELRARGISARFVSAGERHPGTLLAGYAPLEVKGALPWGDYFGVLSASDVVLSLQHSPHPSHPPLDAVASGGVAVTNEMGGTRASLHPRLLVAEPEPTALAEQVIRGVEIAQAQAAGFGTFDPEFAASLGRPLDAVARTAASAHER